MKKLFSLFVAILALCSIPATTFAETTVSEEGQYIFNSLAFYIGGVLVAFMAAGFCMLESGLVTNKSVSTIAAKNIGKFALCSIIFFLFGYQMAYGIPEGGYIGSFSMWSEGSEIGTGYSDSSDWFFQTMFVCATVSIVSELLQKELDLAFLCICGNHVRLHISNINGMAMGRRYVSICWIF